MKGIHWSDGAGVPSAWLRHRRRSMAAARKHRIILADFYYLLKQDASRESLREIRSIDYRFRIRHREGGGHVESVLGHVVEVNRDACDRSGLHSGPRRSGSRGARLRGRSNIHHSIRWESRRARSSYVARPESKGTHRTTKSGSNPCGRFLRAAIRRRCHRRLHESSQAWHHPNGGCRILPRSLPTPRIGMS